MAKPLVVTAAIIENHRGQFLITQRLKGKSNAHRWEFPGGKIEPNENPWKSLKREIKEELGIDIAIDSLLDCSSFTYNASRRVILLGFHAHLCFAQSIKKKQVQDYVWVTVNQMRQYDITEADLPFIERLKERQSTN